MTDTLPPHVDAHAGATNAISRRDVVIGAGAVLGAAVLAGTPALAPAGARQAAAAGDHRPARQRAALRLLPRQAGRYGRPGAHRDADRRHPRGSEQRMLFDNGDLIQGSPMGDFVAYKRGMKAGDVHPMFAGMNALDYTCATLGNHEFNYGPHFLGFSLGSANFPFVCANLVKARPRRRWRKPWIVSRKGSRGRAARQAAADQVGFIGFLPPQIMHWDQRHLAGKVTTHDIVDAAQRHSAPDAAAGATHHGALAIPASRAASARAARRTPRCTWPRSTASTPSSPATCTCVPRPKDFEGIRRRRRRERHAGTACRRHGRLLGQPCRPHRPAARQDATASWRSPRSPPKPARSSSASDSKVVPRSRARREVEAAVKADHEATLDYVRRAVGETAAPLHSYFALVADDPSVQIVAIAQTWYVEQMPRAPSWEGLPVLSAAAPFKAGGRGGPDYYTDVPAGPVAIKNVADLYLYPNTVRAVKITGAEVKEWLERSAGIFNQIEPGGADQPLINPDFPAYNFDVIDGVTYQIDVTQPSSTRGRQGERPGRPPHRRPALQRPADRPGADSSSPQQLPRRRRRQLPRRERQDDRASTRPTPTATSSSATSSTGEGIDPVADNNWRIAPLPPGVVVTFVSAPQAAKSIPKGLRVKSLGDAPGGFSKFELEVGV